MQTYLDKEKITYEIYQEERKIVNIKKRKQDEDVKTEISGQKNLIQTNLLSIFIFFSEISETNTPIIISFRD